MHFKQHLALIFAAASLVTSQNTTDLPDCAREGALQAINASGCTPTDIACVCESDDFTTALEQYAKTNCSPADYTTAITVGQAICAKAGVTISASSSTTSSLSAATDGTVTVTGSTNTTSSGSAASSAAVAATVCECETRMPTPTTTTPVATFTGAAARQVDASGAFAGLLAVLEVLAFL